MRFVCQVTGDGEHWCLAHTSEGIGPIQVIAPTREEALRKMQSAIRYWLEMCPCSGEQYRDVEIEFEEVFR